MPDSEPALKKQKTLTSQSLPDLIASLCSDISTLQPTQSSSPESTNSHFAKCHTLFRDIIDIILKKYLLMVGNATESHSTTGPSIQYYQILELEMYCSHPRFRDPYTHAATIQKQNAKWYFHRKGEESYSGGSFKGLDVSVGGVYESEDGAERHEMHGGILIRTLRNLESEEIITGPSLCVDKILSVCGHESIKSLVNSWKGNLDAFDLDKNLSLVEATKVRQAADGVLHEKQQQTIPEGHHHPEPQEREGFSSSTTENGENGNNGRTNQGDLQILHRKLRHRSQLELLADVLTKDLTPQGEFKAVNIIPSLRVGIYLNNKLDAHLYCAQLLRWVARAPEVKKGKTEMILALLHEGYSQEKIATMAGVAVKSVKSKEDSWNKGRKKDYKTFLNKKRPKVGEYCEMVGSLDEYVVGM